MTTKTIKNTAAGARLLDEITAMAGAIRDFHNRLSYN
jgi:hypothetical protein